MGQPGNNSSTNGSDKMKCQIKDVWADNLAEEMAILRDLVEKYPYISMDTEFPGVVAKPVGNFKSTTDYQFQTLRCNVDLLKIIQLGLTFSDENGNFPEGVCTWQFNFKFNLSDDMFAQDAIDLLQKSGIDFQKHSAQGIEIEQFGEVLISSGFVLIEDVKWIAFHGTYDFGYLLKVLTCEPLPEEEADFHILLKQFFPCLYDIKYLVKSCKTLQGGLQQVADTLAVERIGPQHQAGSDSLLTSVAFFKLRKVFFEDKIDDSKYLGHLYGLGAPHQFKSVIQNANSISHPTSTTPTPISNGQTAISNSLSQSSGSSFTPSSTIPTREAYTPTSSYSPLPSNPNFQNNAISQGWKNGSSFSYESGNFGSVSGSYASNGYVNGNSHSGHHSGHGATHYSPSYAFNASNYQYNATGMASYVSGSSYSSNLEQN